MRYEWREYARKTVKHPHRVTRQSDGNFLFEKKFSVSVGLNKKNQKDYYLRVVLKPNGHLVTAFPAYTYKEAGIEYYMRD